MNCIHLALIKRLKKGKRFKGEKNKLILSLIPKAKATFLALCIGLNRYLQKKNNMKGRYIILLVIFSLNQIGFAQTLQPGTDFAIVVSLATKFNKSTYMEDKLAAGGLSEKDQLFYENTLEEISGMVDQQETYIKTAFAARYMTNQVYFIYDYMLKADQKDDLFLIDLKGQQLKLSDLGSLPVLFVRSGDFSPTFLTEESLRILNNQFEPASAPLGMFKTIKVRGNALFALKKPADQWARSVAYFQEHLNTVFSSKTTSAQAQESLFFTDFPTPQN